MNMQVYIQVHHQNRKRDHALGCMWVHTCKWMFKQVINLARPVCQDFPNALLQFNDEFAIKDESPYIVISTHTIHRNCKLLYQTLQCQNRAPSATTCPTLGANCHGCLILLISQHWCVVMLKEAMFHWEVYFRKHPEMTVKNTSCNCVLQMKRMLNSPSLCKSHWKIIRKQL